MNKLMEKTRRMVFFIILLAGVTVFRAGAHPSNYQMFYDALSPYGQWIQDPEYGYVWAPGEGPDFRPYYTNGKWVMTEYGNTWVSGYDWGWAPFHYGRWTYNDYYGWLWIPGDVWGPAWVNWRSGGGYYGWAPLGPGVNIQISFGSGYNAPDIWWTFIPSRYLYHSNYHRYWRGVQYNKTIIHHTTIINHTYNNTYVYGPRRAEAEKYVGKNIPVYELKNETKPGRSLVSAQTLSVYKPEIRSSGKEENHLAPKQYVRPDKPVVATAAPSASRPSPVGSRAGQVASPVATERPSVKKSDARVAENAPRTSQRIAPRSVGELRENPQNAQKNKAVPQPQRAPRASVTANERPEAAPRENIRRQPASGQRIEQAPSRGNIQNGASQRGWQRPTPQVKTSPVLENAVRSGRQLKNPQQAHSLEPQGR